MDCYAMLCYAILVMPYKSLHTVQNNTTVVKVSMYVPYLGVNIP